MTLSHLNSEPRPTMDDVSGKLPTKRTAEAETRVRVVSSAVAPVYGLILAGGASSRMHRDKAALLYRGKTQLDRAFDLARGHVDQVFVSVRASQAAERTRSLRPLIVDMADLGMGEGVGPIVGIRSAMAANTDVAWLVIACDLPFLSDAALKLLLRKRDPRALVTAF